METTTILLVAVLFILFLLASVVRRHRHRFPHYAKRESLFTRAERSFYGVLALAVSDSYIVFAKVRIADVVTPRKTRSRKVWWAAFNKVSAKHFDFVLCDPQDLSVKFVVELNDSSHKRNQRRKRDEFVRHVCDSAGLRLVEIDARKSYPVEQVRGLFAEAVDAICV